MTPKEAIIKTMRLLRSRVIDYATPNDDIIKEVLGNDSNGWISVEEELPEVGVKVLTTTRNGIQSVCYYDGSEWRAELPGFVRISVCMAYITHWMPLPERPKGGEE